MSPRCILVLAAACGSSAAPQKGNSVSQLPTCSSAAQLAPLDGQRVVLVGIYRKRMVARKQGQPATQFYGYAQLELTGQATDYDPAAWSGAGAIVRIGTDKRPEDEIARLADQPVSVEGRLVLHPPIADPNVASVTPGPTLFEVGAITPR